MKHTIRKFKRSTIGVVGITLLGSGGAFAALYGFGPAESWTIQQIAQETTAVTTSIAAFGASFSTEMQTKFEQIISAVAVATKQEALSANVVTDGTREASAQLVNAVRVQRESDQVSKALLEFNPVTGQGFDPCGTNAKNKTLDMAFNGLSEQARISMSSNDVAPGRLVSSIEDAMQLRLKEHRQKFCTANEAAAGLCTESEIPGGDTNAALLFEPVNPNTLKDEARRAYIQNVLGEPDRALSKAAGGTPAGEAYLLAVNQKQSLLSVPAYSLAMIKAANTRSEGLSGKSPNEVLRLRVNQYFGGKEAEAWSGSMARQAQRGLLVETLKMQGLEVWLHHKQYEQNQRLEANLAALVLATSDRLKTDVESQYHKVLRDSATQAVQ